MGVFRHGSKETSRIVTVPWLFPDKKYEMRRGFERKLITTLSGKSLSDKGFSVMLNKEYDGELFEITEVK